MDDKRNFKLSHTFKAEIICFSQNPQDTATMAVACMDNSLVFLESLHCRVKKRMGFDQAATDIQFDPFSANYIVVCFKNGEMIMYETVSCEQVRYIPNISNT